MAIQISEKYLSPKAKKALANAKSKSQLLRDALEYYVSREESEITATVSDPDMKADIKEIKELLLNMSLQPAHTESAIAKDTFSTSSNENLNSQKPSPVEEVKEGTDNQVTRVENPEKVVQPDIKHEPVNVKEPVTSSNNDGMSEEEKQKIASMLDNSLDMF